MELDLNGEKLDMKFSIGQTLVTRGVNDKLMDDKPFARFVAKSFCRHCNGDWGDLCEEDKLENERALKNGNRLFSKYNYDEETSIYIITEYNHSATTILFPDEY